MILHAVGIKIDDLAQRRKTGHRACRAPSPTFAQRWNFKATVTGAGIGGHGIETIVVRLIRNLHCRFMAPVTAQRAPIHAIATGWQDGIIVSNNGRLADTGIPMPGPHRPPGPRTTRTPMPGPLARAGVAAAQPSAEWQADRHHCIATAHAE